MFVATKACGWCSRPALPQLKLVADRYKRRSHAQVWRDEPNCRHIAADFVHIQSGLHLTTLPGLQAFTPAQTRCFEAGFQTRFLFAIALGAVQLEAALRSIVPKLRVRALRNALAAAAGEPTLHVWYYGTDPAILLPPFHVFQVNQLPEPSVELVKQRVGGG